MTKRKLFRVVALVMAFAMALAMAGCTKERSDPKIPTRDPSVTYTVKVTNRAGTGLKKCSVEVFSDASMTTQIYKGIADDKGEVTFKAEKSDDYVAVITKLPWVLQ